MLPSGWELGSLLNANSGQVAQLVEQRTENQNSGRSVICGILRKNPRFFRNESQFWVL
jgi:hypothetical protein